MPPTLKYEQIFWNQNPISTIAGVDEVGRGCLAGPVVAAAVVFPSNHMPIPGINDSKKISATKRQSLFSIITQQAKYSIQFVSVDHIYQHNILHSSLSAMSQALDSLLPLDHIFVDGIHAPASPKLKPSQFTTIKQGDSKCYSIAAASILAKVARDDYMTNLHSKFPQYDWIHNKGYGTAKHRQAILKHGPTSHHRTKFLRKILG